VTAASNAKIHSVRQPGFRQKKCKNLPQLPSFIGEENIISPKHGRKNTYEVEVILAVAEKRIYKKEVAKFSAHGIVRLSKRLETARNHPKESQP
jgi:hypothetical protein